MTTKIPSKLNIITQYIRRAEDLEKSTESSTRKKVVAFYCRMYALDLAFPVMSSTDVSAETKLFVVQLIDRLELDKKSIDVSKEEGKVYSSSDCRFSL